MDIQDFHGKVMQLEGVDQYTGSIKKWDNYEECQCIRFKLDGFVYVAIEDPSDGYRSYLGELKVDDEEIKNPFTGVEVKGVYRTSSEESDYWTSKSCSIIDLVDTTTNEVVVSIGTDNDDDYYPWFVGYFNPKAMSVNKTGETK